MSNFRKINIFNALFTKLWNIGDANEAKTTSTVVGAVQIVDQTGKVPPSGDAVGNAPFSKVTDGTETLLIDSQGAGHVTLKSDAGSSIANATNTARTTGTIVIPTQLVDATGKVQPAGEVYTNPIFTANRFIDEAGVAYGVRHIDSKPRVSSMPYLYDIAEGIITGHTPFSKLGYNADVGSTEEDIITQGGSYYWIPTATALEVLSSSANDTISGTGVQKVKIYYLDADYSESSQVIDMNGVTPVPLTDTTILRVNAIRATQVGSGGVAAGTITVRTVVGTNTVREIAVGYTRGRGLAHTVPLGKTLYITSITIASGYTTSGKVVRWIGRAQVDDTAPTVKINLFQAFFETITEDASFVRDFEIPIKIPATADLKVSAISDGAGSFCSCSLRGWLE